MSFLLYAIIFLLGLAVGSFLNVVILRGAAGGSIRGRSHCVACRKQLGFGELLPVASFFLQKRRCRSCGGVLSWQYPLVEFGTGISYVLAVWLSGFISPTGLVGSIGLIGLVGLMIAIAAAIAILVSDLRFQIIPNGAVAALLVAAAIRLLSQTEFRPAGPNLVWDIISAALIALFFAALWLVSGGRWMGLGDAKLIFATSLLVGFPTSLPAFLFSFWSGGLVGIGLLALGGKNLKSRIPFGPFILAGTAFAYFFADWFKTFTGLNLLL